MKNVLLIWALGLLMTVNVMGQINVKGKVLDAITKKPLVGASISVENKKTTTDNNGSFTYICNSYLNGVQLLPPNVNDNIQRNIILTI